ncbi:holin family protein [Puniceibacterium sp. IMCC21224]|uniref:holin family protein n=1 Tax=Puniceibacterium sp. IMCC21224 TaxID=1618204 RepID=UPI00064DBD26|nr:holin family protein [Puniceibacterium sp. IMCC21224]KMK67186.1 Protein of unknown function (DUF3154) [Puniceibacterium sp. IMCC21224]
MGLIDKVLGLLFGSGRNLVAETAEVFRVNAEAQANREAGLQGQALDQFGREFLAGRRCLFDRFMDGLNRVPRPALALGTLGLFIAAMIDPVWFAERMTGLALVPEPLWWLLGAIVSFYFGARHQAKGQDFRRDLAATVAAAPQVVRTVEGLRTLRDVSADVSPPVSVSVATTSSSAAEAVVQGDDANPALAEWRALAG